MLEVLRFKLMDSNKLRTRSWNKWLAIWKIVKLDTYFTLYQPILQMD